MMTGKKYYWRYSQIALILILGFLIFRELWMFSGGFLGALTIYILVRKQMHWMTERRGMPAGIAAVVILIEVIVCFLIPATLAVGLFLNMLSHITQNMNEIISSIQGFVELAQEKAEIDLMSKDVLIYITGLVTKTGKIVIGEISSFLINALILLFVLYFMLVGSRKMENYLIELLPFNDRNKKHMLLQVDRMILSNAIGIPLLAVMQGVIATVGYLIFDVPFAFLFGVFTCFATIIPLVGTALVWMPLVLYLAVTGDWVNALGLAIFGLIVISNVDNLFRFLLQKKMADVHPLITVFGVLIGLSLYGFWGVIFGPVLISIFLILVDMFKKEHLDKKEKSVGRPAHDNPPSSSAE